MLWFRHRHRRRQGHSSRVYPRHSRARATGFRPDFRPVIAAPFAGRLAAVAVVLQAAGSRDPRPFPRGLTEPAPRLSSCTRTSRCSNQCQAGPGPRSKMAAARHSGRDCRRTCHAPRRLHARLPPADAALFKGGTPNKHAQASLGLRLGSPPRPQANIINPISPPIGRMRSGAGRFPSNGMLLQLFFLSLSFSVSASATVAATAKGGVAVGFPGPQGSRESLSGLCPISQSVGQSVCPTDAQTRPAWDRAH